MLKSLLKSIYNTNQFSMPNNVSQFSVPNDGSRLWDDGGWMTDSKCVKDVC